MVRPLSAPAAHRFAFGARMLVPFRYSWTPLPGSGACGDE
jgi:hypothetical protein